MSLAVLGTRANIKMQSVSIVIIVATKLRYMNLKAGNYVSNVLRNYCLLQKVVKYMIFKENSYD